MILTKIRTLIHDVDNKFIFFKNRNFLEMCVILLNLIGNFGKFEGRKGGNDAKLANKFKVYSKSAEKSHIFQ